MYIVLCISIRVITYGNIYILFPILLLLLLFSSFSECFRLALTSVKRSSKKHLYLVSGPYSQRSTAPSRQTRLNQQHPIENTSNQWLNMLKPPPSSERQDTFPPHQTLPTTNHKKKKHPCGPTKKRNEIRTTRPVSYWPKVPTTVLPQPMRSVRFVFFAFRSESPERGKG